MPESSHTTHFPGHLRSAFEQWLDDDMPDQATIDINYEDVAEPAPRFLARFPDCGDILPRDCRDMVNGHLGLDEGDDGYCSTYGEAAERLLHDRG